jgi:hypothetical protein
MPYDAVTPMYTQPYRSPAVPINLPYESPFSNISWPVSTNFVPPVTPQIRVEPFNEDTQFGTTREHASVGRRNQATEDNTEYYPGGAELGHATVGRREN